MKRYNKYIVKGVFALLTVVLAAGCTGDFEDLNTNPFAPTPDQMMGDNANTTADLGRMFEAVIYQHENKSQFIDQMIGFEYGGMTTTAKAFDNDHHAWYNPPASVGDTYGAPFAEIMPDIYTGFNSIRKNSEGKGAVFALASILRVAATLKLSDMYGPMPYSQVTGVEFNVPYDSMEDLYNHMFDDLAVAVDILQGVYGSSGEVASTLADADLIFGGNVRKWIQFGNTLQMRMAIRISNVAESLAKAKFNEAMERGGVMESADDGAWRKMADGQPNPYYKSGIEWREGGDLRPSASLMSYLNGYGDPRREKYVTPQTTDQYQWRGVLNGSNLSSSIYKNYYINSYVIMNEGVASSNSPMLIMSASEAWFLRAEAALNGWTSESAKSCYEHGVTVSMAERGVSAGDYLSSTAQPEDFTDVQSSHNRKAATTVCPKYDEGASKEVNRERILIQKWLADFPNGWETWADIRRTGYPKHFQIGKSEAPSGEGVTLERGMRRLKFPLDEYNTNAANVKAAVALLGGPDLFGTDLWWAKKN